MPPPPLAPDEMDAVFGALASKSRRRILDVLKREPGANVNRVCEYFDEMGRVAVLKHVDVLEAANLVVSERVGRERRLFFNPVPIHMIHDRWTTEFSEYWGGHLARLKYTLENAPIPIRRKGGKGG